MAERDQADREAAELRRTAYYKGNANHPLPVSDEVGRLIVQDEGNPDTVRINLYAEETGRLVGTLLVKRQHTARYALWLLQASMLRTEASASRLDPNYPQNLDDRTDDAKPSVSADLATEQPNP